MQDASPTELADSTNTEGCVVDSPAEDTIKTEIIPLRFTLRESAHCEKSQWPGHLRSSKISGVTFAGSCEVTGLLIVKHLCGYIP